VQLAGDLDPLSPPIEVTRAPVATPGLLHFWPPQVAFPSFLNRAHKSEPPVRGRLVRPVSGMLASVIGTAT
jgi:hypothetical protein